MTRHRDHKPADTAIPAPSSSEDWTPPPPQACLSPPLLVGALVVGLGLGSLLALAAAALAWSLQ